MMKPAESTRYHALDCVRATAMLLGVVYHTLLFRMFFGGGPPGPMGVRDAPRYLEDWLHSFRMPLFFLISGFFARMMFQKYGTTVYLRKRWTRIGVPLLVGMFTFGPAYVLTRDALTSGRGPGGGPPGAGGGPPPLRAPVFVPPPLARFDQNGDGSFSDAEWAKARKELERLGGGPPPGGGFPPGGPMPGPFGAAGGGLARRIFGGSTRLVQLNHLWFLWYLLVFATLAPVAAKIADGFRLRTAPEGADRFSTRLIRSGFAPLVLGVITAPALMLSSGPFGWSLGLPGSIFRAFPDFLLHLDPEMAFYAMIFLAGWWLHRERDALPSLARGWLPDLLLGLLAFAASTWLSDAYRGRTMSPYYPWIRWGGFTLYSVGSAATAFAFLGFFQRYLDRPTATGRYLADTALWVYLVHQPLVCVGLAWLMPLHLPWWMLVIGVFVFAVATALLLYEAVVRPTPLVHLFGPLRPKLAARPRESGEALVSEAVHGYAG